MRLWNPATGQPIGSPLKTTVPSEATGVAFSPDGKILASAGADGTGGTVRLWSLATGHPIDSPLRTGYHTVVNAVAFSPDGKVLASGDSDGTVRLWNPATGQPIGSPLHTGVRSGRGRELGGVQPGRQDAGRDQQER